MSPSANDGTLERVISPASGHFGVSPLKNEGLLNLKSGDSELGNKNTVLVVRFHVKFRGFVWMKWFGLKIGLKLKIIEFSSIWRVYFFGVFDHVSWNFGCQTLFCFGSFLLLQRMIHFSVLEMKKHGQKPPAWPYVTFVIFYRKDVVPMKTS